MVVEELVTDQDRAIWPEPEHEVAIAGLRGVEPNEMGVDTFVRQSRLHRVADLVVADVGRDGGRESEPCEPDGRICRIPASVDRHRVLERDLAAEGKVHPVPVVVLRDPDVRVGQPDEDVGRGVAHAEHVVLRHGTNCPMPARIRPS